MKRSIIAACCLLALASTQSMAQKNMNPYDKSHYIIADMERSSEDLNSYTLSNFETKGISFDEQHSQIHGRTTSNEDVRFVFHNASTTYGDGKFGTALNFWYYKNGSWHQDSETRQGRIEQEDVFNADIILVLDFSNSIGTDIGQIRGAAESFIQAMADGTHGSGIMRVGIVTFNQMRNIRIHKLEPLTMASASRMKNFINGSYTANMTALYCAMDKAYGELNEHYNHLSQTEKSNYKGATMIVFTDGLDNASTDIQRKFDTDDYHSYICSKVKGSVIGNYPLSINSYYVRGKDVVTDADERMLHNDLECVSDHVTKLENYRALKDAFLREAENMINKTIHLTCYAQGARSQKVAWTFQSVPSIKPPKPSGDYGLFLGVNGGLGAGILSVPDWAKDEGDEFTIPFSVGIDFAYPINKKVAVGAFIQPRLYLLSDYLDMFGIAVGPMVLVGNYVDDKAFLGGIGLEISESSHRMVLRAGAAKSSGLYWFGELNFGNVNFDGYLHDGSNTYNYSFSQFYGGLSFHIGYNFGKGIKVNK